MTDKSFSFLRLRTIAFNCVNFVSFLWIILYSIVVYSQWDPMSGSERALIVVMLIANVATIITLLVLLLVEFRVWLDIARICFLLIAQIGTSGAFAYWRPRFHCADQIGDQQGICDMISTYILIVSWIIPALLIIYLCGLAYRLYRLRPSQDTVSAPDTEKAYPVHKEGIASRHRSLLPIMTNLGTPIVIGFPPEVHNNKPRHSVHTTRRSTMSAYSRFSSPPPTPGRLAKRSPMVDLV